MTQQTTRPQDRPSGAARGAQPADGRPVALIILGASGDLTSRLLLPGLARALAAEDLPQVTLVGASPDALDDDQWRERVRASIADVALDDATRAGLVERAVWRTTDATDADELRALLQRAAEAVGPDAMPVLYFAVPPKVAALACAALEGIADRPESLRLALEKPFGVDEESARELNALLTRIVPEDHVFRVDHFLGESMVTALLGLRTANRLLESVWSAEDVERVDIVADETIALEGRAGYYDTAGALRDMIQSHLLQVMAMAALEPPARIAADDLRDAVIDVLRATRVRGGDPVTASRRARYTAGSVAGRPIPDYAAERGVDPARNTETLAEVELEIDTPRWAGVPFRLRSGKALGARRWEVTLTLRPPKATPLGLHTEDGRDTFVVGLEPRYVRLDLSVDTPDTPFHTVDEQLGVHLGEERVDAYGEVLRGIVLGDPLLAVRGDAAEECWRIVEPVLQAWAEDEVPLDEYAAGSSGPEGWASSR